MIFSIRATMLRQQVAKTSILGRLRQFGEEKYFKKSSLEAEDRKNGGLGDLLGRLGAVLGPLTRLIGRLGGILSRNMVARQGP